MSRVLQEPRSKCVHRVSPAARWKWRRSWASRATQRSKLPSPGSAPTYSPASDRDTTTSTVSTRARHKQTHRARLSGDSGSTCMCSLICDGLSHLPLHCLKRRHSVCVCRPVHLSLAVSARGLVILLRTAWSSATRFRPLSGETRMLANRPHTSSNLVFSLLPVPLCEPLINIEIGFPREHMGTHSSAESPKKSGTALNTFSHPAVSPPPLLWWEAW